MLMSMPNKQDEGFWDDGSVTLAQLNKAEMNHILSKANSMSASQVYLSLDCNHPGLFLRFLDMAACHHFSLLTKKCWPSTCSSAPRSTSSRPRARALPRSLLPRAPSLSALSSVAVRLPRTQRQTPVSRSKRTIKFWFLCSNYKCHMSRLMYKGCGRGCYP